jgi:molybdate transport system substrate-binding protein
LPLKTPNDTVIATWKFRIPLRRSVGVVLGLLLGTAASAADLTVCAAASLTNAFRELAPVFEAQNPGTRVRLNFGASGALLQQIAKGAPADVYASADAQTMDQAQARALVRAGERRDFASNTLVVVVPSDAGRRPGSLTDLGGSGYARIAIGLPASVPVGRYTQGALQKAGLWAAIEPKMIGAQNVRQALDYVARGEVDAGFVYATDAARMPGKVQVALTVPTETPILYPIAPVASAPDAAAAQKFVAFVLSASAQAVFAKHGFGRP